MTLTGSIMMCDARSVLRKVMLRSGTAVDRSHPCCSAVRYIRNTAVTGTPVDTATAVVPAESHRPSCWHDCSAILWLLLAYQVGPDANTTRPPANGHKQRSVTKAMCMLHGA